jgi:GMP synthase-like glutamine amidotransferase
MRLLVIQHVPHERLGTFEDAFTAAGCSLRPLHAYDPEAVWPPLDDVDGLVTMGGPQSVYEQAKHPSLRRELVMLREALDARLPILGVCLGAQLLAAALGARVAKSPQKEIGWYPLMREPGADGDPLMAPFGQTETVFQWHGDTFALPKGAVRLASSPLCPEQGFRWRDNVYALQFHLEVTEAIVRAWMRTPVNRTELAALTGVVDPMTIKRQSAQHVGRLSELSAHAASTFAALAGSSRTQPRRRPHAGKT